MFEAYRSAGVEVLNHLCTAGRQKLLVVVVAVGGASLLDPM